MRPLRTPKDVTTKSHLDNLGRQSMTINSPMYSELTKIFQEVIKECKESGLSIQEYAEKVENSSSLQEYYKIPIRHIKNIKTIKNDVVLPYILSKGCSDVKFLDKFNQGYFEYGDIFQDANFLIQNLDRGESSRYKNLKHKRISISCTSDNTNRLEVVKEISNNTTKISNNEFNIMTYLPLISLLTDTNGAFWIKFSIIYKDDRDIGFSIDNREVSDARFVPFIENNLFMKSIFVSFNLFVDGTGEVFLELSKLGILDTLRELSSSIFPKGIFNLLYEKLNIMASLGDAPEDEDERLMEYVSRCIMIISTSLS